MNPGPRFGFAWDPRGDGKMAIRGGYGIFFEHMNGNEANAEVLQQGPAPNSQSSQQPNVVGYTNVGAGAGGIQYFPISPLTIPTQIAWPYVQQWNLGVQKELPGNFFVSASYVGSKGTHLAQQRDINQLHTVAPGDNPFLASGAPIASDGSDCNNFHH